MKREKAALVDEARCIGCALCLPPCPVDCIDMVAPRGPWSAALKRAAGQRAVARSKRRQSLGAVPARTAADRKRILDALLGREPK